MADKKQLEILREGVDTWNEYVEDQEHEGEPITFRANLAGADLSRAHLMRANLAKADLSGADLTEARLDKANLDWANLEHANLSRAGLQSASLNGTYLRGANLAGSNLSYAVVESGLTNTLLSWEEGRFRPFIKNDKLAGANLTDCVLAGSSFVDVNLRRVKGLSSVRHFSPAIVVSLGTLRRSEGKIPDIFLKGTDLADWEILNARLYDPELTRDEFIDIQYKVFELRQSAPIQAGKIFISYSRKDEAFVDELHAALDKKGIRSWRDVHDAEAGPLDKVIDRAIRLNPIMLLVLSKNSVSSGWVGYEIEKAVELERVLNRPVLCPVALDESWLGDLRADLRTHVKRYTVLDLSGEGAIEKKMPRILEGLQVHYRGA